MQTQLLSLLVQSTITIPTSHQRNDSPNPLVVQLVNACVDSI